MARKRKPAPKVPPDESYQLKEMRADANARNNTGKDDETWDNESWEPTPKKDVPKSFRFDDNEEKK